MGLLKRLFGQKNPAEEVRSVARPRLLERSVAQPLGTANAAPLASHNVASRWIEPGDATRVQGFDLLDGMIYIGSSLQHSHPSLIDPDLPIDIRKSDNRGDHLTYWPAYNAIPPSTRTAYLDWLSTGRRRPTTPIGFVFIYFYGLERRVIVDSANNPNVIFELGAIRAELSDLVAIYGASSASFDNYASDLIGYIDIQLLLSNPQHVFAAPRLDPIKEPAPVPLQAELSRIAAAGIPLPADRALAWAWYLPETSLRTPAI